MAQSDSLGNVNQRPSKSGGGQDKIRLDNYNAQYVRLGDQRALAEAGQLFLATVPTAATITGGTTSHAAPTATDGTLPLFTIKNLNSVESGRYIYPLSYTHRVTVSGAAAASSRFYVEKSASGVSRFTSATATNLNSSGIIVSSMGPLQNASNSTVYYGAVVAPADTAAKLVAEGMLRTAIPIVHDQWTLNFGGAAVGVPVSLATAAAIHTVDAAPMTAIAPGETLCIHLVQASQSAASFYSFKFLFAEM